MLNKVAKKSGIKTKGITHINIKVLQQHATPPLLLLCDGDFSVVFVLLCVVYVVVYQNAKSPSRWFTPNEKNIGDIIIIISSNKTTKNSTKSRISNHRDAIIVLRRLRSRRHVEREPIQRVQFVDFFSQRAKRYRPGG